jgi:hypothetical protein
MKVKRMCFFGLIILQVISACTNDIDIPEWNLPRNNPNEHHEGGHGITDDYEPSGSDTMEGAQEPGYAPDLSYADHRLVHTTDYDLILKPGETGFFRVSILNDGATTAPGVTATFSSGHPHITIVGDPEISYGNIGAGVEKEAKRIKLSDNSYRGYYVHYTVEVGIDHQCKMASAVINMVITDGYGNQWNDQFSIKLHH